MAITVTARPAIEPNLASVASRGLADGSLTIDRTAGSGSRVGESTCSDSSRGAGEAGRRSASSPKSLRGSPGGNSSRSGSSSAVPMPAPADRSYALSRRRRVSSPRRTGGSGVMDCSIALSNSAACATLPSARPSRASTTTRATAAFDFSVLARRCCSAASGWTGGRLAAVRSASATARPYCWAASAQRPRSTWSDAQRERKLATSGSKTDRKGPSFAASSSYRARSTCSASSLVVSSATKRAAAGTAPLSRLGWAAQPGTVRRVRTACETSARPRQAARRSSSDSDLASSENA